MNQAKKEKTEKHMDLIVENIDLVLEFLGVTKSTRSPMEEIIDGAKELYDHYHKMTGKRKTDWELVKKQYIKLSKAERKLAYDMIDQWALTQLGKEQDYIKKCWTYLKNKNFNDEIIQERAIQQKVQHFR